MQLLLVLTFHICVYKLKTEHLAKKQFNYLETFELSISSNPKSLLKFITSIFCLK